MIMKRFLINICFLALLPFFGDCANRDGQPRHGQRSEF